MTTKTGLEEFYSAWSAKSQEEIAYDLLAAERKANTVISGLADCLPQGLGCILDFGCGYGRFLSVVAATLHVKSAIGVDFSEAAIGVANEVNDNTLSQYHRLPTLSIVENIRFIKEIIPTPVDCVLLIDLLEHVPDCAGLLRELSSVAPLFIVKLPIEASVLDNYLLPKEYPGSNHSNGHLREFNVNDVHYFVRQIGLTPIKEDLYVYHIEDMFPPVTGALSFKGAIYRNALKWFKRICSWLLPKRIFLRLVGGGGYYCLATFDENHVLHP
jgi:SAM-dependent methyltransferase